MGKDLRRAIVNQLKKNSISKWILYNFFFKELSIDNLKKGLIDTFMDLVAKYATDSKLWDLSDYIRLFRKVLQENEAVFMFQSNIKNLKKSQLIRIIDFKSIEKYLINTNIGHILTDDEDEQAMLVNSELLYGMHTSENEITWVSKIDDIEEYFNNVFDSNLADTIRDLLGLFHYKSGAQCFAIIYPKDYSNSVHIYHPTIFDSQFYPYYMAYKSKDNWGGTMYLKTSDVGVSEAIHKKLIIQSDFSVKYIGKCNSDPASIEWQNLLPDKFVLLYE